jgi:hypothetical protein
MQAIERAEHSVAVLIPCYNEEQTIGRRGSSGFRQALPQAAIYVYDNNSTRPDRAPGPRRRRDRRPRAPPGQGERRAAHVRRRRGRHLSAWPTATAPTHPQDAPTAHQHSACQRTGCDMVVGTRRGVTDDAGRAGHAFGNRIFNTPLPEPLRHATSPTSSPATAPSRAATSRAFPPCPAASRSRRRCRSTPRQLQASRSARCRTRLWPPAGRLRLQALDLSATVRKILWMFAMLMKETRPAALLRRSSPPCSLAASAGCA